MVDAISQTAFGLYGGYMRQAVCLKLWNQRN